MAVKDEYKKIQKQTETVYKNAVANANKAIADKTAEVNARYADMTDRAATRRSMTAFQNAASAQTETARLAENVNLENQANENRTAMETAKKALTMQAQEIGLTADAALATAYAENLMNRTGAEQETARYEYEQAVEEEDTQYQQALDTLEEFGKVMTKKQAKVLGVPVGTTKRKYYSGSGSTGSGSTKTQELSNVAKAVINDEATMQTLKELYDQGNREGYGATAGYYSAYLNQLGVYSKDEKGNVSYHSTNNGTFGNGKVREYLATFGVTDENDIIDIFAAAGLPYSVPRQ